MPFILALDQGTTSSRAIVFDDAGRMISIGQRPLRQIFPRPGWVEHDPMEIWRDQVAAAKQAIDLAKISPSDIRAIGITNQRETAVVWDARTGEPIHNAIVWQDRRTAGWCDGLKAAGHLQQIQQKTGLVIDAYFSASKIRWLLDHIPGATERAARGEIIFGTIDAWLLWNLTGGAVHATDVSNAARTMLLNISTLQWDEDLLRLCNVPREMLPLIVACSGIIGETAREHFGAVIPIAGMAGDQQAALFGQTCFTRGLAKNTYGTGCFTLMNIGPEPVISKCNLLSTVAWQTPGQRAYALEGSAFVGGAVVQWLRDGLGIIQSAEEIEPLAATEPDNGGVYFVPAFAGLGAPHWDQYARGCVCGLTRGATKGHLARAALESIAFQVADILDAMRADSEIPIEQLRVDGGAARNNLLLQFQADLLRVPVVRPTITETTALGAAYLAGLATGVFIDQSQLASHWKIDRIFEPMMNEEQVRMYRKRWRAALQRARDWED